MAAIDMVALLSEVACEMVKLYPSMPLKVLQAICYAIAGEMASLTCAYAYLITSLPVLQCF